ncbi:Tetratricopeptide repeat protein 28 [Triplophysa tibetana]|uniref:Tetratricopeptide repeat protein 28 n=1 Tax=Triplophysa tibetana TaxID=1572043 RepID=A0A5A9N2J5_9TELE|nr:Tetratricopeptide repeat protein 28 [Triplophysa tibetana]
MHLSAESLEPTYQQLQKMKLDKSPFVVVSVIGQELLTASHHGASVVVLEAALKIGTCSLKLRGSVFSALSSAYWSLGNTEKSTAYMQQDLEVAKTLGEFTADERQKTSDVDVFSESHGCFWGDIWVVDLRCKFL